MLTKIPFANYLIAFLIILSTQFHASFSRANTFGDFEIALNSDDNITRSDYGYDKKSDTAAEAYINYGKFYELKNNWSATALVFSKYSNYDKYSELSTFTVGVSGSFGKKLGLGAYSSSISTSLSLSHNNVSDSKRKNNLLELSVDWNKRLNDIWELTAGISLDDTNANNNVFDTSGTTLFFSADYTISEDLLASFGISQRDGDIISVTRSSNPNITYISWAAGGNTVSDDVFGSGFWAYRLNATTLILNAALSYAVTDDSSNSIKETKSKNIKKHKCYNCSLSCTNNIIIDPRK